MEHLTTIKGIKYSLDSGLDWDSARSYVGVTDRILVVKDAVTKHGTAHMIVYYDPGHPHGARAVEIDNIADAPSRIDAGLPRV